MFKLSFNKIKKINISFSIIDYLVLFISLYLLSSVPLLMLGLFRVPYAVVASLITMIYAHLTNKIFAKISFKSTNLILLFICIIAVVLRFPTYHNLAGGQDQGIYVSMGAYFEREGSSVLQEETIHLLPSEVKSLYFDTNIFKNYYPGTHLSDQSGERHFQFYPAHPLLLSLFGHFLGNNNETLSLIFFAVLSVILIYKIGAEIFKNESAGSIGALLIAIHPLHVFFSRFPVSESVLMFFILGFIFYSYRWLSEKSPVWFLFASAMWFAIVFTHIAAFFYLIPLIIILEIVVLKKNISIIDSTKFLGMILLLQLVSIYYGVHFTNQYFITQVNYMTSPLKIINVDFLHFFNEYGLINSFLYLYIIVLIVFYLFNIFIFKRDIHNYFISLIARKNFTKWFISLLLTVLLFIAIWKMYEISYTAKYSNLEWEAIRWNAVNNGFASIVRTTPFVILMYSGPLLLFAPAFLLLPESRKNQLSVLIIGFLLFYFFIIRGLVLKVVPYHYYYARYLLPEFLTTLILFAMYTFAGLKKKAWFKVTFLAISIIYFGYYSMAVTTHREMKGLTSSIQQIADKIKATDFVFVISNSYTPHISQLLFPLKYYYGFNVIYTDLNNLNEYLQLMDEEQNEIFVISNEQIGDLGQEVVFKTRVETEELRSDRFIPTKSTQVQHKNSLLLLRYEDSQASNFLARKLVLPNNYLKKGVFEDGWSKDSYTLYGVNFLIKPGSEIEVIAQAPSNTQNSMVIDLNETSITLNRDGTNHYRGIFTDNTTMEVRDLTIHIKTVKPCDISKKSRDCRDLGLLIDKIILNDEFR